MNRLRLALWRAGALLGLLLAAAGVVLPLLPTVPFLLLAAACASRGWPALDRWLLAHPRWGPPLSRWRERRAVPLRAKWLATASMAAGALLLQALPAPLAVRIGVPLVLLAVAAWLWRRPHA
jgi:uncharacterized membrane protein YbaN (DUF454 family)